MFIDVMELVCPPNATNQASKPRGLTKTRYTVDSCFLATSWHVTSNGMFAGACIGVILLVILLEFLRRLGKEYDRNILRDHQRKIAISTSTPHSSTDAGNSKNGSGIMSRALLPTSTATRFRPSVLQQSIRALFHMLAFAVAYFVML
jgi:copper transporter 1